MTHEYQVWFPTKGESQINAWYVWPEEDSAEAAAFLGGIERQRSFHDMLNEHVEASVLKAGDSKQTECSLHFGAGAMAKLDIHILLDAYQELNKQMLYDPELDETIQSIKREWNYTL